jgi:hypothetical protein
VTTPVPGNPKEIIMKQCRRKILTAAIAGLLLAGSGFVHADSGSIEADKRAKIMRAKAKRDSQSDAFNENGSASGGCGNQQVGNVFTGGSNRPPREVTTIITGDVINIAGRGCK